MPEKAKKNERTDLAASGSTKEVLCLGQVALSNAVEACGQPETDERESFEEEALSSREEVKEWD